MWEFFGLHCSVRVPRERSAVLAPAVLLAARRLGQLLGVRLVVVRPEALALAGGHHPDFVSPSVAAGALQLDPPRAGVRWHAAVIRGAVPPPLSADDGVRHEVGGKALARAHQLPDGLGAAAGAIGDVAGGAQLPAAQLRGTWRGESAVNAHGRNPKQTQGGTINLRVFYSSCISF